MYKRQSASLTNKGKSIPFFTNSAHCRWWFICKVHAVIGGILFSKVRSDISPALCVSLHFLYLEPLSCLSNALCFPRWRYSGDYIFSSEMALEPSKFQIQKFYRKANSSRRIIHDFFYSHIQIFTVWILFTKINLINLRPLNAVAFENSLLHFVQFLSLIHI